MNGVSDLAGVVCVLAVVLWMLVDAVVQVAEVGRENKGDKKSYTTELEV
jgi:hypothetical protein